ncbi:uncharacterized protein PFL1_00327 [Pseudozyma flocculosa PF-1]|uniref:Related to hydrolase, CocE/NonD family n=1 Tax=Pseudozyma flocculosa TaxID=84751 RepID=A0A5C3ERI6_9BASI|nr:uncharacterized protein PFL1_00327 [Pseudozyma flocculosa PF-1]EPQ32130.1 hypothetical protein PFL1_00327 [Pseudozyma flocculosa PF-1]SPO34933.1 related to hydrolase, CocE/NonD family [Pseudozyma flocculosa]
MPGERLLPFRAAQLPTPVKPGENAIKTTKRIHGLIFDQNVDIPIPRIDGTDCCRCNVYRPEDTDKGKRYPVIMTHGPYGKDIPYSEFYPQSFEELPESQKSSLSAWETPEPTYWTKQGYVVVRVDEQGTGESPGFLDTMSDQTANNFFHCIEWAASQSWSSGKVGLLGISYFAGSQWRAAARKPKGLACIVPWEGMSDFYRDRARHGGILSNGFIALWQNYQVNTHQYGRPPAPKPGKTWGPGQNARPGNVEGSLSPEQLKANRTDQTSDNAVNFYMDDDYYSSRDYSLSDIDVPLLSVGNWGGITLHLRGNVMGYLGASSRNKWLWFITGRHDLPFYLPERVELQKSFLDAFLHDNDTRGWLKGPNAEGGVPAVNLALRKGAPKFNTIEGDRSFPERAETQWPLPQTRYTPYYLSRDGSLRASSDEVEAGQVSYRSLESDGLTFNVKFDKETEITGHPTLRLVTSIAAADGAATVPKDLDVFLTLRHLDAEGKEIFYTGTAGDPCPVTKGWLRASVRKVDASKSNGYYHHREYLRNEAAPIEADKLHAIDIEIWPTNVVVAAGNTLQLEVGPKDQQGHSVFPHNGETDRTKEKLEGQNVLHLGPVSRAQVECSGINDKAEGLKDQGQELRSALVLPIIA